MRPVRLLFATAVAVLLLPGASGAMTMDQFSRICASATTDCSEHPLLNAYIGGALDLIAVLDEETDYLDRIYCKPPPELFDVPAIIRFMQTQQAAYATRNAMLLVVRYLEENGGC